MESVMCHKNMSKKKDCNEKWVRKPAINIKTAINRLGN